MLLRDVIFPLLNAITNPVPPFPPPPEKTIPVSTRGLKVFEIERGGIGFRTQNGWFEKNAKREISLMFGVGEMIERGAAKWNDLVWFREIEEEEEKRSTPEF